MVYDLEDLQMWEPVLYGATSKKQLILDVLKRKESQMVEEVNREQEVCVCVRQHIYPSSYLLSWRKQSVCVLQVEQQPRVLEMPRSWVSNITISKKGACRCLLHCRCPHCSQCDVIPMVS